jgi:hypothetical protein
MAAFTDVGMELTVITQVIENIGHQFRFNAAERDVTRIVPVTSEVGDHEHTLVSCALNITALLVINYGRAAEENLWSE